MAIRFNWLPKLDGDVVAEGFAVGRVNLLLARIFSIGSLAVGIQMLLNALSQVGLLNPIVFWLGFGGVLIGQLGLIYGAFFSGKTTFWFRWYSFSIAAVIFTWWLAVRNVADLPDNFYPWAWWGVGLAAISAFGGLSALGAMIFLFSVCSCWFIGRFFEVYGAADFWLNLQDTVLAFLFASVLGALILVARFEASRVDEASARKVAAAVEQAKAEALTREKTRVDALVHDKVLTTLLLASKAETVEEQTQAGQLALLAIAKLTETDASKSDSEITAVSFFGALSAVAKAQDPNLEIYESETSDFSLPEHVASALSEASIQALINSQQHAGMAARRELHLKAKRGSLKIVVKDNGRGFRMSRVPKNRLGIRISILERVEAVGGRAFIDSSPGRGAAIVIEWSEK